MSNGTNKGIGTILRINTPKKKTPVTREEEEIEDAIEEYFVPTKDENLFPSLRYQNNKKK